MLAATGWILLGLCLLVLGGEILLRGAVQLATLMRMTPAVIGLTVVAAGTSVPELAVSMIAAARGSADIAVGNAVGSNIFNIAFILGLGALVRPLSITGNTIKLEYPVMALVTLVCVAMAEDGTISRLDGAALLALHVGFTVYLVGLVRERMSDREQRELSREVAELSRRNKLPGWTSSITLVLLGAGLLAGGAQSTVSGAVDLATLLGLSERVIGLTIVSIGTGLPEVVTTLLSVYRGRDDVAIGNVIGSNLFNMCGILGITSMIRPLPVASEIRDSDMWWMLGITFLLFPLLYTEQRIVRWEGLLLLGVYGAYLATLLVRP